MTWAAGYSMLGAKLSENAMPFTIQELTLGARLKAILTAQDARLDVLENSAVEGAVDDLLRRTQSGFDAFGRVRVSNPTTLFDSKQLFDSAPLYWDDSGVSGSGTTTSHSVNRASTTIGVGATTAGKRVRQTFQRFNYQPGKSLLALLTGVLQATGGGAGISTALGYFDDNNGVFLSNEDGTTYLNIRSKVTGSVVDNKVAQSSWNVDTLDGTGDSGVILDVTKSCIFFTDIEWLGVGTVRCGFVVDGEFIVAHKFHHANIINSVYMSTPNLPVRYEIENDGTGVASTLEHICSTVISEGGHQETGQLHLASTASRAGNAHVAASTTDTLYAVVGLRVGSGGIGRRIDLSSVSMLSETNDDFEWSILYNPTVAGTFTYGAHTNSVVEVAYGATANTVTGGTPVSGGFGEAAASLTMNISNALRLGHYIDNTPTTMVLCVRPLSTSANIHGALGWREWL